MIIECIQVGQLQTNCYLVAAGEGRKGVIIDPGDEVDRILAMIDKHSVRLAVILNTHGHWDHIGADRALADAAGAKIFIHENDVDMLADPAKNLSSMIGDDGFETTVVDTFVAGESIHVGELSIRVIHTPGHTPGGVSFLIGENLFSGDLVFLGSVGRIDLPGGAEASLFESIRTKVMTLPDSVRIFPGHGEATSVGRERAHNPYLIGM